MHAFMPRCAACSYIHASHVARIPAPAHLKHIVYMYIRICIHTYTHQTINALYSEKLEFDASEVTYRQGGDALSAYLLVRTLRKYGDFDKAKAEIEELKTRYVTQAYMKVRDTSIHGVFFNIHTLMLCGALWTCRSLACSCISLITLI
jgi:hypothetical protein